MDTEEMVQKLWEDMYMGRGKNDPSVISRLDRVEQVAESFAKSVNKIIVGMILLLLGILGDVVKHAIK